MSVADCITLFQLRNGNMTWFLVDFSYIRNAQRGKAVPVLAMKAGWVMEQI
jgi:hypothetical protein